MKYTCVSVLILGLCIVVTFLLKHFGYISYYVPAKEIYLHVAISNHCDDTLRVALIGDSWAEFHSHKHDCRMASLLSSQLSRPVLLRNGGVSGLTSKQIYQNFFSDNPIRKVIEWGPDVCIVFAGVNDSDRKLGVSYYLENMRLIVDFLLYHHIIPVVLEIPYYNTKRSFSVRNVPEKTKYIVSMLLNLSTMDCIYSYRLAFENLMIHEQWHDRVIYIKSTFWNADGYKDQREIYDDLQMHLNPMGYQVLDSCLSASISSYLLK